MDRHSAFQLVQEIAADLSSANVVFPTSFATTIKLREALQSEETSVGDIAEIVIRDPLLAARVVQMANSAIFNQSGREVTDVRSAVMKVGFSAVRSSSLALALRQLLTYREMARFQSLSERLMEHSRKVAGIACYIARKHSRLSPDVAMFAGLVHDIGLFYLLYQLARREDVVLNDVEVMQMLHDWHDSIGHAVLSALGIPDEVKDAVTHHDDPRVVCDLRNYNDLIFVANLLAERVGQAGEVILPAKVMAFDLAQIRDFELYVSTLEQNSLELATLVQSF